MSNWSGGSHDCACSSVHTSTWAGHLKGSVDMKTSESAAASAPYRLFPLVQPVITRCSCFFSPLNLFSHCCSVMHLLVRCDAKADLISLLWNHPPHPASIGGGGGGVGVWG